MERSPLAVKAARPTTSLQALPSRGREGEEVLGGGGGWDS